MKIKLNNTDFGYKDYDVSHKEIKRACVPYNLKKGDFFNVYTKNGSKHGCEYNGQSIVASLEKFVIEGFGTNPNDGKPAIFEKYLQEKK